MQMARLIGTTVLRRKFRRVSAVACDRRARLDPAPAAVRASLAARLAPILSCIFIWAGGSLAWSQTAGVEERGPRLVSVKPLALLRLPKAGQV
jgi:hypothetical protein